MELAELIRELGAGLGLSDAEPDEDGAATLVIDDTLEIVIEPGEDGHGILISAAVGTLPGDAREAVFAELLEANLMGQGTGAAALAIDPDREEIVLCRMILKTDLDFDDFDRELVVFANALRYWRERSDGGQIGKGPDGDAQDGDGAALPMEGGATPVLKA